MAPQRCLDLDGRRWGSLPAAGVGPASGPDEDVSGVDGPVRRSGLDQHADHLSDCLFPHPHTDRVGPEAVPEGRPQSAARQRRRQLLVASQVRTAFVPVSQAVLIKGGCHMGKLTVLAELWEFLRIRRKWWLIPILFFIVVLGSLIALTSGSVLAPFIYTLF